MAHYASNATLTSPVVAQVTGEASGTVLGSEGLRRYFHRGLDQYPNLKFTLLDVLRGISSVVVYYRNHKGTRTGEFMEFDTGGKVSRVVANYSG